MNGVKNASQTGREVMIGALDGKEVCTGMQPCRRADASCRRRSVCFFHAWADHYYFFLLISFVLTGVDETKATANEGLGGVARFLKGRAKYGVGFNRFCLDGET